MEEYKVFCEAPSRREFILYFIKLLNALSGISPDFETPRDFLIENLTDYSTVNKKFFTGEELKMLQKFFQHTMAHTPYMEERHRKLFDQPWIEERVTSKDLHTFFCNATA